MKTSMVVRSPLFLACAFVCLPLAAAVDAKTYVLPVVVRGVPGINGSFWDSEVRIVNHPGGGQITVRRVWVALEGGGFVDEPATAPRWEFPETNVTPDPRAMIVLSADDLLQGVSATHAAVALEVEGAGGGVFLHIANSGGAPRLAVDGVLCCLRGNGQLVKGFEEALQSGATIAWATSGKDIFRTNLGLINPSSRPLMLAVWVAPARPTPMFGNSPNYLQWGPVAGTFYVSLPPWSWTQINDVFVSKREEFCPGCFQFDDVRPVIMRVWVWEPANETAPFYAYASVIYTPLNDPEFIAATP